MRKTDDLIGRLAAFVEPLQHRTSGPKIMTFTAHTGQIYSAFTQRPFPSKLAKQTNESPRHQRGRDTYHLAQEERGERGEGADSHTNMAVPPSPTPPLSSHEVCIGAARSPPNKSAWTPTFTTDPDLIWHVRQEWSRRLS